MFGLMYFPSQYFCTNLLKSTYYTTELYLLVGICIVKYFLTIIVKYRDMYNLKIGYKFLKKSILVNTIVSNCLQLYCLLNNLLYND